MLVFMLLVNRTAVMGDVRNRPWANVIAAGTSAVMVLLNGMMVRNSVFGWSPGSGRIAGRRPGDPQAQRAGSSLLKLREVRLQSVRETNL